MASPQTGIFALGTASHAYLEFDLHDPTRVAAGVARAAALREPRTTIGGVNLAGTRQLRDAGACGVAVVAAILGADDVEVTTRTFLDALASAS